MYDLEIMGDAFEELQNLLKEEAIEEINWSFVEAFELPEVGQISYSN